MVEEKKPTPGGILTHDLLNMRRVLDRCAITVALVNKVGYFVNNGNFHGIEFTFCRWVVPLMAKGSYLDTSLKISDDDRFWAVAPFHSTSMLVPVPTA